MALLSHAIADLSGLRREQMKPALKPEIHSLCTKEISEPSAFLFGEDLAKQIRDAKETTRIGKAIAGSKLKKSYKHREPYQRFNGSNKRAYNYAFLAKGQKSTSRKKYPSKRDDSK